MSPGLRLPEKKYAMMRVLCGGVMEEGWGRLAVCCMRSWRCGSCVLIMNSAWTGGLIGLVWWWGMSCGALFWTGGLSLGGTGGSRCFMQAREASSKMCWRR